MKFRFIAKKLEINANIGIFDTLFNTISLPISICLCLLNFHNSEAEPTISIVQKWVV